MNDPIRVLHVDDEAGFTDLAATFLERADDRITVETATDAGDGLKYLHDHTVDCIVSDYDMQERNGIEFLGDVRAEYPDLPFILFTGKGSEEIASRAISAGVTDYLQKEVGTGQYDVLANRITNAVEQRRTERNANRLRQRLQELTENLHDCVWLFDREWEETLFISGYEQVWGRPVDAVENDPRDFLNGVYPADRETVSGAMDRLSDGISVDLEYRICRDDGPRWVWTKGEPIVDRDGNVVRIAGFTREITERKEREQTLSALHTAAREIGGADESAAVYETLTETAERILEFDLVAVDVEDDGYLIQEAWTLDVEDRAYHDRTSLETGDTFAARSYNRQETIVVDDLRECEITPADPEYRSAVTVPIGEFGTFQAVASEVDAFDQHDREFAELLVGHARVKLAQLQDKRALQNRTEQLERQNERLDEFVKVVSHDLRNPVTVAKGNLDLVRDEHDSESLEDAAWAVDRIDALIDDLLTLAREGEEVGSLDPVDLGTLSERCWRSVATGEATLEVAIETDSERVIEAHESRLQQLLENLVRNAIDHGGPNVTITVGRLEDGDGFYVADDGAGIPEANRDDVFEIGYSTSNDGAGFGLNIVKQIVDAHGWTIDVTDGSDGGTRFEIRGVNFVR
ncbi:response regulator [Natronorubrum sp. JWXQ-INN-674]|uniref:histidine kinase n=1 Tax=Natronorubrum halalkaliphilum TaxID=2691917 RepID=A0A6B0VLW0_9EURY|nr:ATP-binding protein [Natronorubrum halalkaliphilum]MXV62468.1 response regulator [Natronorubrum halalkaliphilum]